MNEIEAFKGQMMKEFEMTDLCKMTYFIGIEFTKTSEGLVMHQMKYVSDMLKRFNMLSYDPASSPVEVNMKLVNNEDEELVDPTLFKQIVGSLRYLCNSRPNIAYSVGIVSRFMSKLISSHLIADKRVTRFIKGTMEYGILFPKCLNEASMELIAYSDEDWCGDRQDRKSTSGYLFKFLNAPISWCAKNQLVVALSTCESEYIVGCLAVWLESILKEMKIEVNRSIALFIDNKSAINLAKIQFCMGGASTLKQNFTFLENK